MQVKSVFDNEFKKYGQVLFGYDFSELFSVLEDIEIPNEGIEYKPSVKALENCTVFTDIQNRGFGGMKIQLGYCNGINNVLNCLEYHKSSEFNIAKDDIVLLLGLQYDITDGKYDTSLVEAFHIPAGVGVELFGTTLHYAPCGFNSGQRYQVVCALPKDTNLERPDIDRTEDIEAKMCFGSNKWLLAHRDSPEAQKGAYIGLVGDNLVYEE